MNDKGDNQEYSNTRVYLASVYYAVSTIATVGFGDITPTNDCNSSSTSRKDILLFLHGGRSLHLHEFHRFLLRSAKRPDVPLVHPASIEGNATLT